MASILFTVFVLQLVIHLINVLGGSGIDELLWILLNKLPIRTSKTAQEQARLRREVVRLKREMNATSAQDEFSKWAKIRRQHDKVLAEYEKTSAQISSAKQSFSRTLSALRLIITHGAKMVIQFWYAKIPIFWLPLGWLPYYAEWLLSFPRAPLGSVSIYIWGLACATAISLVSEAIAAVYSLSMGKGANEKVPQAVPAASQGETKKEL